MQELEQLDVPPERKALAALWRDRMGAVAATTLYPWYAPHVTCAPEEGGQVVLEWWRAERKLSLYFGEKIEFLRIWGPSTKATMDDGGNPTMSADLARDLWIWLHTGVWTRGAVEDAGVAAEGA